MTTESLVFIRDVIPVEGSITNNRLTDPMWSSAFTLFFDV